MKKRGVMALVVLGGLLASSVAMAEPKKASTKETKSEQGYGYTFDDDPLGAGGFGAGDATIVVRPKAARATLTRPRTEFIAQMLKSIENI